MSIPAPRCSCIVCHEDHSSKGINSHFDRMHGNDEIKIKYPSGYNGKYHILTERAVMKYMLNPKLCPHCNEIIPYKSKENKFCSKTCSVIYNNSNRAPCSHVWTAEEKLVASERSKLLWEDENYSKRVLGAPKTRFTSRNEVAIRDHFISNFEEDGWTYGGGIKYKDERISRDLYSSKLKICFEYDGIWHFEDIHDQLKSKQYKDQLLEEWCVLNEYSLIRLDEDEYNKNHITIDKLVKIFYSITSPQIIKIGNRYK